MMRTKKTRIQETIPTDGCRKMYGGFLSNNNSSIASKSSLPTSTLTSIEIEERCQIVLAEIDRCHNHTERYIESSVLHNDVLQTFVPSELCIELEEELDRLLTETILREERIFTTTTSSNIATNDVVNLPMVDPNSCLACNSSECTWTPFCNTDTLSRRKKELYRELKSSEKQTNAKTLQSIVARSAINGGETTFIRSDLIKELSDEIHEIDTKLSLAQIDSELHDAYACQDDSITIRSIHGYEMAVNRRDGILALEHEHNRHIANLVSTEIVDGILDWMLQGWYFGERDKKVNKRVLSVEDESSHEQRGSLMDKASNVQLTSNSDALLEARRNDSTKEDLQSTENTTKYGLFCLTFAYFRALHVVRKEKAIWNGSNNLCSLRSGPTISEEKKKMIQEEKKAEYRRNRIELYMEKARVGEERKLQRLEKEQSEKTKIRQWHNKQETHKQKLATTLQRVWRGYVGRKMTLVLAEQQQRIAYEEALRNSSATNIARVWRGFCGRIDAGYLRAEMAKFLFDIRQEEARDEEEEYYATTNRLQRKMMHKNSNVRV